MILAGDFIPKNLKVRLPKEFGGQLVLANLEGPICADGLPRSNKVGVCLHTKREMFECSECSNVRMCGGVKFAFSLANNHMMDFQEEGLWQTEEFLVARNIPFAGAGADEAEARKPMILEENGKRIAVFCCCERQFGMATADSAGCAEKGVWLYNAIREMKVSGRADFVIVSCHAANEHSPWISPGLHDFYHSLVDAGADCIHGHHAHVPQGFEEYGGKPIFYGLGNFVVDPRMWPANSNYQWSVVADVRFAADRVSWSVRPYRLRLDGDSAAVSAAEGDQLAPCNGYLECANRQFENRRMLVACWQEASVRLYHRLYGQNLRLPAVAKISLSVRDRFRKVYFSAWDILYAVIGFEFPTKRSHFYAKSDYVNFSCESHYDATAEAMGVLTTIRPDCRSAETIQMADVIMGASR